jgi:hypothetical protein
MHGSDRSSSRILAALLRGVVLVLLAPALVVGSFDLHSSDLPHGAFDGPSEVLPGARHPLAPEHLEASPTLHIAACFTCLLQLQTSSRTVTLPAIAPAPAIADVGYVSDVDAPSRAPELALRSRAPPAA